MYSGLYLVDCIYRTQYAYNNIILIILLRKNVFFAEVNLEIAQREFFLL